MKLAAFDSETTRFNEPAYALGRKSRIEPFRPGKLVLGSIAIHEGPSLVLMAGDYVAELRRLLEEGYELVGHNISYDIAVALEYDPTLRPLFAEAGEASR